MGLEILNNILGKENIGVYLSILCGLVAGLLIGFFTEYSNFILWFN